jgi:hypothetical protein
MDSWLACRPVLSPTWHSPEETIQQQVRGAFKAQAQIGLDQFFRGQIATAWQLPISTYYKMRQPGASFTPEQMMRNTIKELWVFCITILERAQL